jgi:hypothetical protein
LEDPNYKTALQLMIKSMTDAYEANEKKNHQLILTLGQTPELLLNYGYTQLPIAITGKVIDKSFFDHGISKQLLERTYKIIETPKAIYEPDNNDAPDGAVLISYEINKLQEPLIIAIHPNKQLGGRTNLYNNIASIYFKQGNAEARWKQRNLLRWEAFTK